MRTIKSVTNIRLRNNINYYGSTFMYADAECVVPLVFCQCPLCGGDIHNGMISCPDERDADVRTDKYRCGMVHYGYGCSKCLKTFDLDVEWEGPIKPWLCYEKIGIAVVNPRGVTQLTIATDKESK